MVGGGLSRRHQLAPGAWRRGSRKRIDAVSQMGWIGLAGRGCGVDQLHGALGVDVERLPENGSLYVASGLRLRQLRGQCGDCGYVHDDLPPFLE
jgi:hypothetical protein